MWHHNIPRRIPSYPGVDQRSKAAAYGDRCICPTTRKHTPYPRRRPSDRNRTTVWGETKTLETLTGATHQTLPCLGGLSLTDSLGRGDASQQLPSSLLERRFRLPKTRPLSRGILFCPCSRLGLYPVSLSPTSLHLNLRRSRTPP